ncbi:MAG: Uma2 family endonuclease [Bacteroidia bacterium]|nr:Uma2 family endonuclease [Bacteroidia bacterium]
MLFNVINKIEPPYTFIKPSVNIDEYFDICDEDTNAELITGEFIMHSPASFLHEDIFRFIFSLMNIYVSQKKLGKILGSRFPVKLSMNDVFEPDILFVPENMNKNITQNYYEGCPPFVLEILSHTTKKYDLGEKLVKYFKYGVKEYWVIDPFEKWLRIYSSKANYNQYNTGKISSKVINSFWINVEWLWNLPFEKDCLDKILE